jgi:hypothetical protein
MPNRENGPIGEPTVQDLRYRSAGQVEANETLIEGQGEAAIRRVILIDVGVIPVENDQVDEDIEGKAADQDPEEDALLHSEEIGMQ